MTHLDEQPTTHTTGRRMTTEEETVTECRSNWYADSGVRHNPGDRECRCTLPKGHDGLHMELIDGQAANAWPPTFALRRRSNEEQIGYLQDAVCRLFGERADLAAELGRVQEAFDRAKPVIDAARAWARWHRSVYVENQLQPEILLVAAVDAYDTAQKAPDVVSAPLISADDPANPQPESRFLPEREAGPRDDSGPALRSLPDWAYGPDSTPLAEGVDLDEAIEAATNARLAHRLRTDGPVWSCECGAGGVGIAAADRHLDAAAVRAAAPIIRRPVEQERDEARANEERERDSLARRCAWRYEEIVGLRKLLDTSTAEIERLKRIIERAWEES